MERPNRFLTVVEAPDGRVLRCFCPNPGRMGELTTPGRRVLVAPSRSVLPRATTHDHLAFHHEGEWVCVDTRLANGLAKEAWKAGLLPEVPRRARWRAEVKHGDSRLDWALEGLRGGRLGLLEAKSVTLAEGDVALFPDAPTVRGARHLRELAAHAASGAPAFAVFVVQREGVRVVRPFTVRDPDFTEALREALGAGVGVAAVACRVTPEGVIPLRRVSVEVEDSPSAARVS